MATAGQEGRGLISGMPNLSRNLDLITGASVMGFVFALITGGAELAGAAPPAIARGMPAQPRSFGGADAVPLGTTPNGPSPQGAILRSSRLEA